MSELADVSESGILHCNSMLLPFLSSDDCYLRGTLKAYLNKRKVMQRRLLSVPIELYPQKSTGISFMK